MLNKKIEQKRSLLDELTGKEEEFERRYSELEEAIEQASEQEEIDTVEELINELEEEQEEHNSKKQELEEDRKSTRLNSSHVATSYAVFCMKKKTPQNKIINPNKLTE